MDRLEIEYEEHKGGCSIVQVDSHNVHVSFGAFTNVELEDMDILIRGAGKLQALFEQPVEKVKEVFTCGACYTNEQSVEEHKRRNSIPKALVRPIRMLALQIILEHFAKNPKDFTVWLKRHSAKKFAKGREFQARKIYKALSGR
jgi:hypothetical protein